MSILIASSQNNSDYMYDHLMTIIISVSLMTFIQYDYCLFQLQVRTKCLNMIPKKCFSSPRLFVGTDTILIIDFLIFYFF